jgi:hypothetical protein
MLRRPSPWSVCSAWWAEPIGGAHHARSQLHTSGCGLRPAVSRAAGKEHRRLHSFIASLHVSDAHTALGGCGGRGVGCVCAVCAGLLRERRAAAAADGERPRRRCVAACCGWVPIHSASCRRECCCCHRGCHRDHRDCRRSDAEGRGEQREEEQRRSARGATVSALSNRRCMRCELLPPSHSLRARVRLSLRARHSTALFDTASGERTAATRRETAEGRAESRRCASGV